VLRRLSYRALRRAWPPLIRNVPTVREASFSLLAGLVIFLGSGAVLASSTSVLIQVSGLIALIPASNALRGDIYGPLGSRLGTYLHTGLIRPRLQRSRVLEENLLVTATQSLTIAFPLAFLSWLTLSALGVRVVGLQHLIFVATLSAGASGLILSGAAFVLSSVAFRRGLNPDNVNAPLITAGGDLLSATLLIGLGYTLITIDFSPWVVLPVDAAMGAATLFLLARTLSRKRAMARSIFRQSVPILAATVTLELLVGLTLENSLDALVAAPMLLVLLPPFLGQTGNFASIHASRLSSAVHLGTTVVGRRPDSYARADFRDMAIVAAILFPAMGLVVFGFCGAAGIAGPPAGTFLLLCVIAGAICTAIVLPLGYYTTFVAFKLGADPDNVVIPITNSTIDLLGVVLLLGTAGLLAII
jgi:mgtE-like transporter